LLFCVCFQQTAVQAQGVGVVSGAHGHYLHLDANNVLVNVEDQVAVVTSTQRFENTSADSIRFTFAFPLAEDASPIGIRWFIDNVWYRGIIEAVRPDTTLPGGGGDGGGDPSGLRQYLGETPFYFDIEHQLAANASVIVELQYVQLLPYAFGNVDFEFPNTYAPIQAGPITEQSFQFDLSSQRSIDNITMLSHPGFTTENLVNKATMMLDRSELDMDTHYHVRYTLSQQELGLFGFSTLLVDSLVADERAGGFFTFVVEPDPNDNENVIEKVFTLIIDRSGSMQGDKIIQARDAASFIVNNLNEGDRFNIVDFSSSANNFRPEHVLFNESNKQAALDYISGLNSGGGTNIADALTGAISQFEAADDNTANLIVFFTDGEATIGVEDTPGILALVESAVAQAETNPVLHTFGIGTNVDTQLLTLLATNNGGQSAFLGNDELESRITEFYLGIRSPVLLNTSLSFDQAGITDVVPFPLPSLYKGQQMIVS
ncbi:unnamed protein product, partial [Laminaria digitata]